MNERPRYCPRCNREDFEDQDLCNYCGEGLVPKGYCGVCEASWPLPCGASCPKHEIELEASRPSPGRAPSGEVSDEARWVTVATFAEDVQAEASRIRLEAEGIPTFLEGTRMGSSSMYQVATGGVKLAVPEALAADARVVLAQTWTPKAHDDLEDAWDDLRPEPYATRRRVMKGVIIVILAAPILTILIATAIEIASRAFGGGH